MKTNFIKLAAFLTLGTSFAIAQEQDATKTIEEVAAFLNIPKSLIFGALFSNSELVPKRVEFLNRWSSQIDYFLLSTSLIAL